MGNITIVMCGDHNCQDDASWLSIVGPIHLQTGWIVPAWQRKFLHSAHGRAARQLYVWVTPRTTGNKWQILWCIQVGAALVHWNDCFRCSLNANKLHFDSKTCQMSFRFRMQCVMELVKELRTNETFCEEAMIEIAGVYGSHEEGVPGPFLLQGYCM